MKLRNTRRSKTAAADLFKKVLSCDKSKPVQDKVQSSSKCPRKEVHLYLMSVIDCNISGQTKLLSQFLMWHKIQPYIRGCLVACLHAEHRACAPTNYNTKTLEMQKNKIYF